MDIDRAELERIVNDRIRAAANDWGIYYDTPERLETTRANFVLLNSIRIAREEGKGSLRRFLTDSMSNFGGQAIWVIIAASCVALWKILLAHSQ